MITWNNLDWQFQVCIFKLKKDTTMQDFFDTLDNKISIWKKMSKYEISLIKLASKLHYNPNLDFWAGISRLNQYLLRKS